MRNLNIGQKDVETANNLREHGLLCQEQEDSFPRFSSDSTPVASNPPGKEAMVLYPGQGTARPIPCLNSAIILCSTVTPSNVTWAFLCETVLERPALCACD